MMHLYLVVAGIAFIPIQMTIGAKKVTYEAPPNKKKQKILNEGQMEAIEPSKDVDVGSLFVAREQGSVTACTGGHGRSDGLHAYVHSLDDAVADMKSLLRKVIADNPRLPCFCFGHSTGATIVLKVVLDPKVEACIAGTSPCFFLLVAKIPIQYCEQDVSRGPEALLAKYSDPLVYTGSIRVRIGYEILRIASYLQQNLSKVKVRFLVLHGSTDTVTEPEASQKLYEEASSTDKTIKLYEGLLHDLLFDPERGEILKDIIEWLNCRT
ncbi:unnamed protein product [Ilex paraguariensis]|uniref:Serine aminopeptidase S33 domain-containing protein n=1 Tax=Ilex paraguariensis TaxID=185542 RepID=A0ABC8UGL1_9AQUA